MMIKPPYLTAGNSQLMRIENHFKGSDRKEAGKGKEESGKTGPCQFVKLFLPAACIVTRVTYTNRNLCFYFIFNFVKTIHIMNYSLILAEWKNF